MSGLPIPHTDGGIVGFLNAIAPLLPNSFPASSPVSESDRPSYPFGPRFG